MDVSDIKIEYSIHVVESKYRGGGVKWNSIHVRVVLFARNQGRIVTVVAGLMWKLRRPGICLMVWLSLCKNKIMKTPKILLSLSALRW